MYEPFEQKLLPEPWHVYYFTYLKRLIFLRYDNIHLLLYFNKQVNINK